MKKVLDLPVSSILLFNKSPAYMNKGEKSMVHDFAPACALIYSEQIDFNRFHNFSFF